MKISDLVYEKISPLFKDDIKLVEVEYLKKADGMHLTVYIDKLGGVSIDDCVKINDLIDPVIDELNPTQDKPFTLDVSSYGLDKPLKFDWQFKKYTNELVDVKLYQKLNGKKAFTAKLIAHNEKSTQFQLDNEVLTISNVDIASITPYIEF